MIQLIEAPPRSGKSYFAVNYLCKFVQYDELYNEYVLESDKLIISNIEGLKINHWSLAECLKKKSIEEFFTIANFENIMEKTGKRHIILAIDECHEIFPAGYVNNKVYEFFAYHGHIGLDIILMCQSLERTSRMFNPLLEYVVKVTPRSRAILNNFTYRFVDVRGKYLYSKSLKKKKLVFGAYKSFRKDEQNKPKNAVKHWLIVSVVFLAVAGVCFKSALALVKGKSSQGQKSADKAQNYMKQKIANPSATPSALLAASGQPAPAAAAPVQVGYSSASLPVVSASVAPVEKKEVTVIGFVDSGKKRRYLLSDNRTVSAGIKYQVGDTYFK